MVRPILTLTLFSVFVAMTTQTDEPCNEMKRVFRYPTNAGVHVLDYFLTGETDPSQDRSVARTAKEVIVDDMFRSPLILEELEIAKEILLFLYDEEGYIVQVVTFEGTGDSESWFSQDNFLAASSWKLEGPFQDFKLDGDTGEQRMFFIHYQYSGCSTDSGWLTVFCDRTDGSVPCASYENIGSGSEEEKQMVCEILYSPTPGMSNWSKGEGKIASAFELYVKK